MKQKPENLSAVMSWVRQHATSQDCKRTPAQLANALAASKTPKAIRKWRKKMKATLAAKRKASVPIRSEKSLANGATVA